jgi:menaquinone-9 beta-reductase
LLNRSDLKKVIIIGGGLSGLLTGLQLAKAGIEVELFEKKKYPFHRVCGEYISLETQSFLKSLSCYPEKFDPPTIKRLQLTSINGKSVTLPLDMGGFGISRYTFDYFLVEKAMSEGVAIHEGCEVESINFEGDRFGLQAAGKNIAADLVIGSFGKRSKLDVQLKRSFIRKRSPYLGVKYHIQTDHPNDLIALHNFKGGYCGMSNVEDGKTNLCYLSHNDNLKKYQSIKEMEEQVLFRNPFLKSIFQNSTFLFKKPETINEISFETKQPVEDHILMTGDAAGMITPLCGNGMAMAIHASKIASELVIRFCKEENYERRQLEKDYTTAWNHQFASRLWTGRHVQRLFGDEWTSNLAVNMALYTKPIANFLISKTHGKPF